MLLESARAQHLAARIAPTAAAEAVMAFAEGWLQREQPSDDWLDAKLARGSTAAFLEWPPDTRQPATQPGPDWVLALVVSCTECCDSLLQGMASCLQSIADRQGTGEQADGADLLRKLRSVLLVSAGLLELSCQAWVVRSALPWRALCDTLLAAAAVACPANGLVHAVQADVAKLRARVITRGGLPGVPGAALT